MSDVIKYEIENNAIFKIKNKNQDKISEILT